MSQAGLKQDPWLWVGLGTILFAIYLSGWWSEELPNAVIRVLGLAGIGATLVGIRRSGPRSPNARPPGALDAAVLLVLALGGFAAAGVATISEFDAVKRPVIATYFGLVAAGLMVVGGRNRRASKTN